MAYIKKLKLTYERKRVNDDLLKKTVSTPKEVFKLFKGMQNETREKVVCIHLNPQLKILSYEVVSVGTAHKAMCEPAEIFRGAIVIRASSIIIVHNHPSGDCTPSKEDKQIALAIYKLGELHKILLQDFIIIGDNNYFSFSEEFLYKDNVKLVSLPKKSSQKRK